MFCGTRPDKNRLLFAAFRCATGDKMGVFWNVEASSANVFHNSKKLRPAAHLRGG
jgi:hypothetical protein